MTIEDVSAKIDLRLNKSASGDYDNVWSYNKQEAFNKAVIEWVRRQRVGSNQRQERDEETVDAIEKLQVLLNREPVTLTVRKRGDFVESDKFPSDYLYFKRLTPIVSKGQCTGVTIKSHLREEANVDDLRGLPSFMFEETFHTIVSNRARVYHFGDFDVDSVKLMYYKKPKVYDFAKLNSVVEFPEDVCEQLVDEACKILASDIESPNQKTLAQERVEINN